MCQKSVVIDRDGVEELVMEDVTNLGLTLTACRFRPFRGPKAIEHVAIRSIDFMAGKVMLQETD